MPANRPSAAELLAAVREFLSQDIKALVTGDAGMADESLLKSVALNNAIAVNLLKLLEREAQQRSVQVSEEHALLREVISGSTFGDDLETLNLAMIDLIESDDFVDTDKRVLRILLQICLSKLAIDNPSYSTLRKHRG